MAKIKKKTAEFPFWPVLLIAGLGILLRCVGLNGDFWLDEVWSWHLARDAKSIVGIFFELRHDSNHFLTTLLFRLVGPDASEWVYRLPSLVAAVGGMALAYLVGAKYSKPVGLGFAAFFSLSYPFIHYATEARGYSFMFFFSLAAYYCAFTTVECEESAAKEGSTTTEALAPGVYPWSLLFGLCCVGGFLSHLSFLYTFMAIAGWFLLRKLTAPAKDFRKSVSVLFAQLLLPSVFLVFLYFTNIRGMRVGGAPDTEFFASLYQMLSLALGLYKMHWIAIPIFLILLAWAICTTAWHHQETSFFLSLMIAPFIVWLFSPETPPYPRHFLPVLLFSFLPLALWMERLFRKKWGAKQFTCALGVALWLIGNALYFSDFVRFGRGGYSAAVQRMLIEKPGEITTVSSDHDFRNTAMLDFYARRAPGGQFLRYIRHEKAAAEPPDWVILHSFEGADPSPVIITDKEAHTFKMENFYRSSYLSGWNWALYKRTDNQPGAPINAVKSLTTK